jgi:glyceraldehyde 3-phosphate dehydrogenase
MEGTPKQGPDFSVEAGLNGFGRFGKHLLRYWLERSEEADFAIRYINDIDLTAEQAKNSLVSDSFLGEFFSERVSVEEECLICESVQGERHVIQFTTASNDEIRWIGKPDLFFECSGANTDPKECERFLEGSTELVMISASSLNSDGILVYGHNHIELSEEQRIISYGSCTVNAYVPLAEFIQRKFGVQDSSVHVIHSVPERQIERNTLSREPCTLEQVAPRLLSFLSENNFAVDYTLVPYSGVSIIDFRFRLRESTSLAQAIDSLRESVESGQLRGLYGLTEADEGPLEHKFTPYSAILIKSGIRMVGDTLYIQAYMDNENSVNRFYDLAQYATKNAIRPEQ